MANICENVLKIQGLHTDIIQFDEKFRNGKENVDKNYSLGNLYPTPSLPINDVRKWRRAHWSVKEDFSMESFTHDTIRYGDMETYYYFDTYSTGLELLIKHISSEFPELVFMLVSCEECKNLGRFQEYYKGNVISDEELSQEETVYWFGENEF